MRVYSVALLCGLEITFLYFFDICNFTVVTSRGHYRQLEKNRENIHRMQQSVKWVILCSFQINSSLYSQILILDMIFV